MRRTLSDPLSGVDRPKLRRWLIVFFLALAVPTTALIVQGYRQLKWEAIHQHRVLAEELAKNLDARMGVLIDQEEQRSFNDYAFLAVSGDPTANIVQRSQLASYPVSSALPGLIGYFQVDTSGKFSTPLLPYPFADAVDPARFGIAPNEYVERTQLAGRLHDILSANKLVRKPLAAESKEMRSATENVSRAPQIETSASSRALEGATIQLQTSSDEAMPRASTSRGDSAAAAASDTIIAEAEVAAEFDAQEDAAQPTDVPGLNVSDNVATPGEENTQDLDIPRGQDAFDKLISVPGRQKGTAQSKTNTSNLGRLKDLGLDYRYQERPEAVESKTPADAPREKARARSARTEQGVVVMQSVAGPDDEAAQTVASPGDEPIRTFESEIDPFEFSLLDSGHFVLFRKVWRDEQRFVQGALFEQRPFLQGTVEGAFRDNVLAGVSDMIVVYRDSVIAAFRGSRSDRRLVSRVSSAEELGGAVLYESRLSAPLSDLGLTFSVNRLPLGAGAGLLTWLAGILAIVLCGGMLLLYRLGARQIDLARQQQDFVSAVSHELRTPLTSIRMYAEMLREGWATEDKKRSYYDYICDESERLSRLIANVLQLARMTRSEAELALESKSTQELLDSIRSKVASQVERAGFTLNITIEDRVESKHLLVDPDGFLQIIINLVDNALKFSGQAERKVVEIDCRLHANNSVMFSVRDHGPGIPTDQMKKIFDLFFRADSGLTRETTGTGIGLALANQLVRGMRGSIEVQNAQPGAQFDVIIPLAA